MGQSPSYHVDSNYPGSSALDTPEGNSTVADVLPGLLASDLRWILERAQPGRTLDAGMACRDLAEQLGVTLMGPNCTMQLCAKSITLRKSLLHKMLEIMGVSVWDMQALSCDDLRAKLDQVLCVERARRIMGALCRELTEARTQCSVALVVEQNYKYTATSMVQWVMEKEAPWTYTRLDAASSTHLRGLLKHFEDNHTLVRVHDAYEASHPYRTALMRWVLFALWPQAPLPDDWEDTSWKLAHASAVLLDFPTPLVPGDMLSRLIQAKLKHYGIYIGGWDDQHFVVDFDTDSSVRETSEVFLKTVSEFAMGRTLHARRFKSLKPYELVPRRITLALVQRLSGAQTRYQLLRRNCETFASLMKMGRLYSQQTEISLRKRHVRDATPQESELYVNDKVCNIANTCCKTGNCRVVVVNRVKILGCVRDGVVQPCTRFDVLSVEYGYSPTAYNTVVNAMMTENGVHTDFKTKQKKRRAHHLANNPVITHSRVQIPGWAPVELFGTKSRPLSRT